MCPRALGGDIPDQRRLADQPARQRRQAHSRVVADGTDAAIGHAHNEASLRADERTGDGFNRHPAHLLNGHFAIKIFLQQLGGAGEIKFKTLLDHAGTGRVC